MKPEILAQTPDYVVVNKPAGLIVHSDGRTDEPTLVDMMCELIPDMIGVGEPGSVFVGDQEHLINRSGVVHRLDRDTSGVILFAHNQTMHAHLKSQFQDHTIEKEYRCFVYGIPRERRGCIRSAIGREQGTERFATGGRATGTLREATTYYEVLNTFDYNGHPYAYVRCMPKTGRTHQIRVHMKSLGHPIVRDPLYAGTNSRRPTLAFHRQALHAYQISFTDLAGQRQTYEAPFPNDFLQAIGLMKQLQNPSDE